MSSILTPSKTIDPLLSVPSILSSEDNSSILNNPKVRVDLPDPVRPITPTY